jgi:hypothetical protein
MRARCFSLPAVMCLAAVAFSPALPAQESRLQAIEKAVRTSAPSGGYHPSCDYDRPRRSDFFNYPPCYYYPYPYLSFFPPPSETETPPADPSLSLLSGFHYLYDIDGDLDGFRGTLKLRTPIGSLEGDFTRFRERLDSGHYYLNLYYVDYLFAVTVDPAVLEFGFGLTGLQGDYAHSGGNFSATLQVAPLNPLILEAAARYSEVNESPITDLSAGVGVLVRFLEFRLDYRYLIFEGPDIRGPEFSVRFWF